ncbi:hypothetical protein [Methylovulum miyakonense]|uniref:hypothetical protein n=1 Tax=Methylovulum miyakonense TaxID=645578 RepID=UPI000366CF08|nr:hypothetical protein [Methylovulum miyakonense]
MKKSSLTLTALALLICLSGCDGSEDSANTAITDTPPATAKPDRAIEPKLSANAKPMPNPEYDGQDAAEDLDATGVSAQPVPDMEAEKYDNDIGVRNPEAGDPEMDEPQSDKE